MFERLRIEAPELCTKWVRQLIVAGFLQARWHTPSPAGHGLALTKTVGILNSSQPPKEQVICHISPKVSLLRNPLFVERADIRNFKYKLLSLSAAERLGVELLPNQPLIQAVADSGPGHAKHLLPSFSSGRLAEMG